MGFFGCLVIAVRRCVPEDDFVSSGLYRRVGYPSKSPATLGTLKLGVAYMSPDMLDLLRLDAGARTLGQLLQEREWAFCEITRLREEAQRQRHATKSQASREMSDSSSGLRYLRLREVCKRVGLKTSSVYRLIGLGKFPKQVKLSERTSAWIESEVESFMASRIADRDQGPAAAAPALSPYMRMGEVIRRTNLSSSKIYELVREGLFPKWADLPKIASGWLRSDIENWIESRTMLLEAKPEIKSPRQKT
jgi:prophage regulatory protein